MIKEENINCTIEALILASPDPVSVKKLSETVDNIPAARVRQAIDDLNNIYMGCGNSFRIREVAGGYQVHILPDFEQSIKKLLVKQRMVRLSRAALETLAIIAYKQPVTKIDIEHIRGVATDGVIHNLLQRQLIVISGRAESPGRPLLYKSSNEFLKFFGLNRLSDLPRMDEIEEMIRMAEGPKEQTILPLANAQEKSATIELSEIMPEPDNGDIPVDDMVATADIGDMMKGRDIPEEDDIEQSQALSGDNGSGSDENLVEVSEPEMVEMMASEIESEMIPEVEEAVADVDHQEGEKRPEPNFEKVQPEALMANYEPLSDDPPPISTSDPMPSASYEETPIEQPEPAVADEKPSSTSAEPVKAADTNRDE